jgi:2-(1,2-epoxy-1,2-dihydrophenyl)acetyl-CoA isomerase
LVRDADPHLGDLGVLAVKIGAPAAGARTTTAMVAYTTIEVQRDGAVQTLRLNRPDVLNAFNDAMLSELLDALKTAERDDSVRCLVITGNGRAFSSGQDLDDVKARYEQPQAPELGEHLRRLYNPLIQRLRTIEKPVIAAVNGVAAGAGCSLALACDLRIVAASASFIEVFINVGLVPDSGSTFMLTRLIGLSRAMDLCFTGRKVTADEALQIGLCNQVVADDQLQPETAKLAAKLAALPTKAIGLTKRALNRSWFVTLEDQLAYEALLQTAAGRTQDHVEGVKAFLEKRKPQFKGC